MNPKIHTEEVDHLFDAILTLKDREECYKFFEDVCTIKELLAMAQRYEVALMLEKKMTYLDIADKTGASTATISRVNRSLPYGEDGYAIVADYMASLTTANREYRLRELKMSGRSPYSSSLYAKYSGDMPAWAFLELTSFGTLIDFVRFCARRWGDRRLEASHYDLKRVKSVRNCAAHGSCLINCFAERGAARGSASSGVSRRVAAVGIPKATRRKWMGNTAMQEVATVLVAHSGLVPEGSSRSRAASELAEMFARADGETEALPDKGPDAAARSALEFLRRLTESLGLVE